MRIERFEHIEAWQLARELARKVYCLTKQGRFAQDFGLMRQIQDAAGSSMHNIAEGFDSETNMAGRNTTGGVTKRAGLKWATCVSQRRMIENGTLINADAR